jgi:hypothetical protein
VTTPSTSTRGRVEGDQVGCELERDRHLLGHDRVERAPADGEVGIAHAAVVHRERSRDPVGPAEVAAGRPEVVLEPFGEGVAQGDERADVPRRRTRH